MERAALLADALNEKLSLLHVVPPIASESLLMDELRLACLQMKERSQPSRWACRARPSLVVRSGDPAQTVIETATTLRPKLVVIGAPRRRTLRDTFKSSVAEELAETRRYPMLIVRRKPRRPYSSVVLALDASEASAGAVRCVESVGIVASVPRYTVLHAYEPPYLSAFYVGAGVSTVDAHIAGWRREHRRAISDVLKTESESPGRYDIVLEEGRAALAILNYVRRHTPDLLIMGTRGGGRIHRAFLGSVAREVAQRVRCDVLLIPQQARSTASSADVEGTEPPQRLKASRVA